MGSARVVLALALLAASACNDNEAVGRTMHRRVDLLDTTPMPR